MARIRSIKPEFFDDPDVAGLSMAARLCFIGLWTQADREGRIVDDPRRLKVRLFPFDDVDVQALLDELLTHDFIHRFAVIKPGEPEKNPASPNGFRPAGYIWIRSFAKHQRPHLKEPASLLPDPGHGAVEKTGEHWNGSGRPEKKPAKTLDLDPDPDPDPRSGSGKGTRAPHKTRRAVVESPPSSSAIPKKNRPIFEGSRFTCFEWHVQGIARMLGSHAESFDISGFLFDLDEAQRRGSDVLPPAELWPWLQSQVLAEARKRGLPIADTRPPKSTPMSRLADLARQHGVGLEPS